MVSERRRRRLSARVWRAYGVARARAARARVAFVRLLLGRWRLVERQQSRALLVLPLSQLALALRRRPLARKVARARRRHRRLRVPPLLARPE
eukprot:2032010-Prymnesium_polylepis.1